jgi:hypothetical protein
LVGFCFPTDTFPLDELLQAMKDGAHDKEGKLLGSKRAARAADIILTTPKDKNRLLGSQRLR